MNWNRIKLALLLLVALWANQPVTWACGGKNKTIDPAFKIEAGPLQAISAHVAFSMNDLRTQAAGVSVQPAKQYVA